MSSRNVTPEFSVPDEDARYRLYRLCECAACEGTGKASLAYDGQADKFHAAYSIGGKCGECRGEGRTRQVVAYGRDEAEVGMALITCAREGEWKDCPFGLYDAVQREWLVLPWQASPRNVSDAARVLAKSKKEKT